MVCRGGGSVQVIDVAHRYSYLLKTGTNANLLCLCNAVSLRCKHKHHLIMTSRALLLIVVLGTAVSFAAHAQLSKLRSKIGGKKDTTEVTSSAKKPKGPGLITKLVTKIAKTAGGVGVSTTADLNSVVPNTYLMTNLCPAEVGTADMAFYEGWKPGGNAVVVMFTTKNSFGLNKLDGEVKVNGKVADYVGTGVYIAFGSDNSTKKDIEITTSSGDRSTFSMEPPKHSIKLKSINGLTDNISVDLTKDVVLDIENPPGSEDTQILVKLVAKTVGIKSFYEVGYFNTANKLVIPAAAFRNLNMSPGNKSFMSIKESFLMVERSYVDDARNVSGKYPEVKFANIYNDGKFIKVTGEPELSIGFTLEGESNLSVGKVGYSVVKPNAFLSRCLGQINTIGVKSFAIRGTTYVSETKTENSTGSNGSLQKTHTTLSAQFPQMENEVWDKALKDFYAGTIPLLNAELNASTAPVEAVTSTNGYKDISAYTKDEENTSVQFSRTYETTKMFSAFLPISDGFGINNADSRIMEESKTNALLTVTIDLQLSIEGSSTIMKPLLGLTLQGEQNGFAAATKYFTVNITGAGYKLKKNQKITPDVLQQILQRDDLLMVLKGALSKLKQKEAEVKDYATLWHCK